MVPESTASLLLTPPNDLQQTDRLRVNRYLELDVFAPYPLPPDLPPHPTIRHISLGLELLPTKEREFPDLFPDFSPMDQLIRSITKRAFPNLVSVNVLSCSMDAMFEVAKGKEGWGQLPGWARWASEQGFEIRDGWGDLVKEEEWLWLDEEGMNMTRAENISSFPQEREGM